MSKSTHKADELCSTDTQTSVVFDDVMKLVGDFWNLHIVNALQERELRFSELQRTIPGVNPVTLTDRLKKLEAAQVVTRTTETQDKQSVLYELTEKGRAILPILASIKAFADRYW